MSAHGCIAHRCQCGAVFCNICSAYCPKCGETPGARHVNGPAYQWDYDPNAAPVDTGQIHRAPLLATLAERDEEIVRLRAVLAEARTALTWETDPDMPPPDLLARIDAALAMAPATEKK